MKLPSLIYLTVLLIVSSSTVFTGSFNFFPNSYLHAYPVTTGSYVNIKLDYTTARPFPSILMTTSITRDPGPAQSSSLIHAKPATMQGMDVEDMFVGRTQYVNVMASSGTVFIRVTDLDPWLGSIKSYTVTVSESGSKVCDICPPPSTQVAGGTSCSCVNCPTGFFGVHCTIPYTTLKPGIMSSVTLNTVLISKPACHFFIIPSSILPVISYVLSNGAGAVGIQYTYLLTELAALPNLAQSDMGSPALFSVSGSVNILQQISLGNSEESSISIGFFFYGMGPTSFTITYIQAASTSLLIIVMAVMGSLLCLAFIVVAVVVIRRINTPSEEPSNALVMPIQDNRLSLDEIQRYYPKVMFSQIEQNSFTNFAIDLKKTEGDNDCVICLCPIEQTDYIRVAFCAHYFHEGCLLSWFKKQRSCPYCRQECSREATTQLYQKMTEEAQKGSLLGLELVNQIFHKREQAHAQVHVFETTKVHIVHVD